MDASFRLDLGLLCSLVDWRDMSLGKVKTRRKVAGTMLLYVRKIVPTFDMDI